MTRQTPTYDNLYRRRRRRRPSSAAPRPVTPPVDPQSEWFRTALSRRRVRRARRTADRTPTRSTASPVGIDEEARRVRSSWRRRSRSKASVAVIDDVESSSETSVTVLDESDVILFQPTRKRARRETSTTPTVHWSVTCATHPVARMSSPMAPTACDGSTRRDLVSDPDGVDRARRDPDRRRRTQESDRWLRSRRPRARARDARSRSRSRSLFAHLSVIRRIRDLVTMTRRIGAGDLACPFSTSRRATRSASSVARSTRWPTSSHARGRARASADGAIVEASEEERKRIAGDVHDDSIQVMSAHVMNLQLLRRRVDDPETPAAHPRSRAVGPGRDRAAARSGVRAPLADPRGARADGRARDARSTARSKVSTCHALASRAASTKSRPCRRPRRPTASRRR